MRELKFRQHIKPAYQKVAGVFHYWGYIDDGFTAPVGKNETSSNDNSEQYTGLKDKNGVEIYEGDIVLVKGARICEVIFHEYASCWDLTPRNVIPSPSVFPASYKYHVGVIGNIHENPELLE